MSVYWGKGYITFWCGGGGEDKIPVEDNKDYAILGENSVAWRLINSTLRQNTITFFFSDSIIFHFCRGVWKMLWLFKMGQFEIPFVT